MQASDLGLLLLELLRLVGILRLEFARFAAALRLVPFALCFPSLLPSLGLLPQFFLTLTGGGHLGLRFGQLVGQRRQLDPRLLGALLGFGSERLLNVQLLFQAAALDAHLLQIGRDLAESLFPAGQLAAQSLDLVVQGGQPGLVRRFDDGRGLVGAVGRHFAGDLVSQLLQPVAQLTFQLIEPRTLL